MIALITAIIKLFFSTINLINRDWN